MSTSVTGKLADETGAALSGLQIAVRDESALFPGDLGSAVSASDGTFAVAIPEDLTPETGTRRLGIYVRTKSRRTLYSSEQDDGTSDELPLTPNPITVTRADLEGWTVTLLNSKMALPVREGNAVRALVDDEDAWARVAKLMSEAQSSINLMELSFDVPGNYNATASQELPEIVLAFGASADPIAGETITTGDYRPERLLLDAAAHGKTVRIMLSETKIEAGLLAFDIALGLLLLVPLLICFALNVLGSWSLPGLIFGGGPSTKVKSYFTEAASPAKVLGFKTTMYSRMHAKMVMVDDREAIVLGSPLSQSYWDTHAHHVFDFRRGSAAGEPIPVHDVSLDVRGPGVKDIHDAFALHWNREVAQADQIAELALPAPITSPEPGEELASLQLVRTLNVGAFTNPAALSKGEQGVLEAYLRAIENAKTYIYFENQYFTNETIAQALVNALNDEERPDLQVILLLNVTPDMPLYPVWQGNLIERIRRDTKKNAERFGVFTAWTHDPPAPKFNRTKAMIMPNYVHSKVGIVDGLWATVGSANLDGASLDAMQYLQPLQFGTNRNHELNYLIFNNIDGQPESNAVDALRIALWSEHLGIEPTSEHLANTDENSIRWLQLWNNVASTKLEALQSNPETVDPKNGRVLAFPANAQSGFSLVIGWPKPYRDFLQKSKVDLTKVDLVEHTTPFNFHTGWPK